MAFPETLRALRKNAGLTQEELAREVGKNSRGGLSKSAVSMYECGRREPELSLLKLFADYFGVGLNELTGGDPAPLVNADPELTEYLEELRGRPEQRMLLRVTKNATKAEVEAVVRFIEALRGGGES